MKATKLATKIFTAATTYIQLRDREVHPAGSFDSAGRFSLNTRCKCCAGIRSPSRAYPFSEMVHARTVVHVASMAGLSDYLKAVRKVAAVIDKSGSDPAKELITSKPFVKLLATVKAEVKASKTAMAVALLEQKVYDNSVFHDELPF